MAERPFEQLLERCLQEIARTGDAEAVLRRYPRHADRLRPLLDVALATARHYAAVPEPPGGLAAGRSRLLDAAARERAQATQIPILRKDRKRKMKLILATRLISAILAVVVGIAGVGGGVTFAAGDSLPGDLLYPVKLAGEDVRLSLASTPDSQVALALQFSDERVAEIEALVTRGRSVPETAVARLERHVFRAMNQAAWASEVEMPGLLERIAQRTQAHAQTLEQLQADAQEQTQAQLENARRICQQAHEDAVTGLGDPQTFRSRYQHRHGMPEDVTPPEPPTREPQGGEEGPHGPAGPGQNQMGPPGDDQPGDRDQQRDRQQDRECDPQQDQDRDRQQDRTGDQQQDQDRDRNHDGECDPQQDQDRDRQQDREGDQQQEQDRDRNQDGEGDPQQNHERDGQGDREGDPQPGQQDDRQHNQQDQQQDGSGDPNPSGNPDPSPQGGGGKGNGNG
jgi:hypothetical protein